MFLYPIRLIILVSLFFPTAVISIGKDDTRDAEYAYHDKELNNAYKLIINQLRPEGKVQLREAQRAWIKMRDSDCKWSFSDMRDCLSDRTINRTSELKRTLFHTKNGEYISIE